MVPLVTAAREGAVHAARTASRERARVRPAPAWWRRRGVVITAATLVVVGAVGGVYAALVGRAGTTGLAPNGRPAAAGMRSTVGAGRDRVSGAARGVMDRIRGDNGSGPREGALASATPDQSRDIPTTGTG